MVRPTPSVPLLLASHVASKISNLISISLSCVNAPRDRCRINLRSRNMSSQEMERFGILQCIINTYFCVWKPIAYYHIVKRATTRLIDCGVITKAPKSDITFEITVRLTTHFFLAITMQVLAQVSMRAWVMLQRLVWDVLSVARVPAL